MWILYQVAFALILVLAGPILLLRRGRHYLETLPGRLGRHRGPVMKAPLWLHAVSVGEVGVAKTLIDALPRELPLVVTTITPTGQGRARASLADRAAVAYFPYELGFAIRRFLDRFSPRALILVEGDLWPLVLERSKRRGLPVMVINGRISDGSHRRMRRFRRLLGPLLDRVDRFAVQTDEDCRRLTDLGVDSSRIVVTGNLKFETAPPRPCPQLETAIRQAAAGRHVLIAGSTMRGEEAAVLDAYERLGGGERALLILAPRHPERWDDVEELVARRQFRGVRRSHLEAGERPDVVLLDSLGELAALYRLGAAAFIGGTLVPTGGHNPLEAAHYGVPVAVGASMENFREIARKFDEAAAWKRVDGAEDLAAVWLEWLDDASAGGRIGARGADLVAANQGALDKTLTALAPLLASCGLSSSPGAGAGQ
jgi:3-deoxy-D-manno-octulosonic-acid transferase